MTPTAIKLPISKVRDFLAKASSIQTESVTLPVLKSIRFEIVFGCCVMTKTNNNSFVTSFFDADEEDCSFLIEEERLVLFCKNSKQNFFTISIKEKEIILNDGYNTMKLNSLAYKIEDFPAIAEAPKETIRIDGDVLKSLVFAKTFAGKDNLLEMFSSIYFKDNTVYCGQHHSIFIKSFSGKNFPSFAITANECLMLSQFPYIEYCKSINESYNIYKYENTTYGFIQPSGATGFDYKAFLDRINGAKNNYAKIKVADLESFCQSTLGFIKETFCVTNFITKPNSDILRLVYENKDKGEENILEVNAEIFGDGVTFKLNPAFWLPIIKEIPYLDICIGDCNGFVSIWNNSDDFYNGIISKVD